ncbi:phospholipase D-like domain-containing protein [Streptomyces mutabilis]|uniref:phospholipase D-like domain-containing protein n=1 Tax=Streptomyces mutabilis TaxID=67332 RepID=UPI0033ADA248
MTNQRLRRNSLQVTLISVLALMLAVLGAPPATAAVSGCEADGNYEVCFTYGDSTDTLIANRIAAKVEGAAMAGGQSGDYIRVAMYQWSSSGGGDGVMAALKMARDSGFDVKVVAGDHVTTEVADQLKDWGIGVNRCGVNSGGDSVACTGESGAMHNKFLLISRGTSKTVLQTSSNFSTTQAQHAQNLLISQNDTGLFSHYLGYWNRMNAGKWTYDGVTWDVDDRARDGSNDLSRAYFFPMTGKAPLTGVLQNVTACTTGNERVWLEASLFADGAYSSGIISELNRLVGIGCDVKVIVQKYDGKKYMLDAGYKGKLECHGQHHNKLTLIDAFYAGEWRKAVFVGSYNVTQNSLDKANDTMLRVINGWVTNRYINQFQALWMADVDCDDDPGSGSS